MVIKLSFKKKQTNAASFDARVHGGHAGIGSISLGRNPSNPEEKGTTRTDAWRPAVSVRIRGTQISDAAAPWQTLAQEGAF